MKKEERDEALEKRMHMFDRWVREGKIPCSSKVIPVQQSLKFLQWVLPTQQVLDILRNSRSFALADCLCRTRHKRCDNPLEVCFYTNDVADKKVKTGDARRVDLQEAAEVLKLANDHGLIHLTIYNPEQHVYALCSCCECCCHDIEFMKKLSRPDLVAHADYVASVDENRCLQCGECMERCIFSAQVMQDEKIFFHKENCYGCGLCVSTCPPDAIRMVLRKSKNKKRLKQPVFPPS
ncbi:MAG: 4Fe-4S binding protein [Desulfobacterales bacterium]|nr:4Fe-4S binding protein [Desulfobacterales bacterium]